MSIVCSVTAVTLPLNKSDCTERYEQKKGQDEEECVQVTCHTFAPIAQEEVIMQKDDIYVLMHALGESTLLTSITSTASTIYT